jgi:site-specific recombinase XerC
MSPRRWRRRQGSDLRRAHAQSSPYGRSTGARHTHGNLKAVQKLLGHSSISTGDIYTDWDIDQLAETMRQVLNEERKTDQP